MQQTETRTYLQIAKENAKKYRWARMKRQKWRYFMVLPAIICVVIFSYIPMAGIYVAFSDYKLGKGMFSGEWAGLKYFKKFWDQISGVSGKVMINTLGMNIYGIGLGMLVPCTFALFLNEVTSKYFKKTIQTVTFFPHFLSSVILYSIAYNFFSSNSGMLNKLLRALGIIERNINFMGEPQWAWFLMIFLGQWKGFGYGSVIYLAAITGIDPTLYEAARIDGASRFQNMRYITIPSLLPTVSILLIMNVGGLLSSSFDTMYLFTNQLNREAMEVFSTYIYRMGMQKLQFSYSTASGLMLSWVSLTLTLSTNYISKKLSGRAIY